MEKYLCNSTEHVFRLSTICTEGGDISEYECYRNYWSNSYTKSIRSVYCAWQLFIALLPTICNTYAIISICFAAKRNFFGLNKNFKTTTIFILHYCFVDLFLCLTFTWPSGILCWREKNGRASLFGSFPMSCEVALSMSTLGIALQTLSSMLVALSRCPNVVRPKFWSSLCDKKITLLLMMLGAWVLGATIVFPITFGNFDSYGIKPGWNCNAGTCGYVNTCMFYGNNSMPRYIDNPE